MLIILHETMTFDNSTQLTIPPNIICFISNTHTKHTIGSQNDVGHGYTSLHLWVQNGQSAHGEHILCRGQVRNYRSHICMILEGSCTNGRLSRTGPHHDTSRYTEQTPCGQHGSI